MLIKAVFFGLMSKLTPVTGFCLLFCVLCFKVMSSELLSSSVVRKRLLFLLSFLFCGTGALFAIKDEDNQGRWEKACTNGPDAVVPGFLVNMGPTGARGILKEQSFLVQYVFDESPAYSKLEVGDEVYGANGKKFSEHTFGLSLIHI